MAKKYVVELSSEERSDLLTLIKKGELGARKLNRAHILLLADENRRDETIATMLHTGLSTVARTRQKYVEGGLDFALSERPRPGAQLKLDGRQEAQLIALASSKPPEGRKCWTMQLLANRLVQLEVVDSISDETVRRVLKKTT